MHEFDISFRDASDMINTAVQYRTHASVLGNESGPIKIADMLFISVISLDTFFLTLLFFWGFLFLLVSARPLHLAVSLQPWRVVSGRDLVKNASYAA